MSALAERSAPPETGLLDSDKWSIWATRQLLDAVSVETGEFDLTGYPLLTPRGFAYGRPLGTSWVNLGPQVKIFLVTPSRDVLELGSPVESMPTCLLSEPLFEVPFGTGDLFSEVRDSVGDVWHSYVTSAPFSAVSTTTLLLDIPHALQLARSRAGLPVQDLAGMFGIKRRQFYNLTSGEQQPEAERVSRIARVTDAISEVNGWVGGNSRKTRALLLARLDGDSIYDAAVSDSEERLARAVESARTAAVEGATLPHRLAPSNQATPAEAAAVRGFLRASRDESGNEDGR